MKKEFINKKQTKKTIKAILVVLTGLILIFGEFLFAQNKRLRLITWSDYAPKEVIELFKKETGIDVEVTLSNNEEIISKLRATAGSGFDLAQPSQDRITGPQQEFRIYKPLNLKKIKAELFIPSMLESTKKNTTLKGKVYGVPFTWGTEGLLVNTAKTQVNDYTDLCRDDLVGKVSMRLKRPTLISFAFAAGKDPFALYNNPSAYTALMEEVGKTLTDCKKNVKFYWDNKDQLLNGFRTGEIIAAQMWDAGSWKLNNDYPEMKYIAPKSGATGWVDTFALPSKGKNDAAAYAWINFIMQPKIAAMVVDTAGYLTASKGADEYIKGNLKRQFKETFSEKDLENIHWYPAIPPGLEEIEGRILDRVKAAN